MNTLILYLDTTNNRFVKSALDSSPFVVPTLYQGDVIPVVLFVLEANPSGGLAAPWSYMDDSNVSVKLALVTPASTTPTVHASADLTYVAGANPARYSGTMTMGSGITTLLGSSASATCKLEIQLSDSATAAISTEIQIQVTVAADGIKAGTPPADPAPDRYMPQSEQLNTFAKRFGLPGEGITLTSPDGAYSVTLSVDNAGNFHADVITN